MQNSSSTTLREWPQATGFGGVAIRHGSCFHRASIICDRSRCIVVSVSTHSPVSIVPFLKCSLSLLQPTSAQNGRHSPRQAPARESTVRREQGRLVWPLERREPIRYQHRVQNLLRGMSKRRLASMSRADKQRHQYQRSGSIRLHSFDISE